MACQPGPPPAHSAVVSSSISAHLRSRTETLVHIERVLQVGVVVGTGRALDRFCERAILIPRLRIVERRVHEAGKVCDVRRWVARVGEAASDRRAEQHAALRRLQLTSRARVAPCVPIER